MQIKTHPSITVLTSSHKTTLQQLNQFGPVMKELYMEAAQNSFISGPLSWIYHGADGKPDTIFTLEIAIPIQGAFPSKKFSIKQLPAFKAITHRHEGPWDQLPASYGQILQYIDANKIPLLDECRELYINIDWQHPQNNSTEVQVGVL